MDESLPKVEEHPHAHTWYPEEQLLIRVLDPSLASELRAGLRPEGPPADAFGNSQGPPDVSLRLRNSTRKDGVGVGEEDVLVVNGVEYEVRLENLPTVVECYKSTAAGFVDGEVIKSGDVGQVLWVVGKKGAEAGKGPDEDVEMEEGGEGERKGPRVDENGIKESPDGLTFAMENARERLFNPGTSVEEAEVVREAETEYLQLMHKGLTDVTEVKIFEEFVSEAEALDTGWKGRKQPSKKK